MTAPFPRVRITAGPSQSAATLVDFMEEPLMIDINAPVKIGSPGRAFDELGFPSEAARTITVPVHIHGGQQDVGRAMQSIARAISVPDRWLMLQRRPSSEPAWYRIRPQSPGELDISRAFPATEPEPFWLWELDLTVDSTAVGESRAIPKRGSDSPTSSITNDGWARGVVIDAPGEAPAPLRVDVRPNMNINGRRVMVSTFAVPWDSPLIKGSDPAIIHEDTAFSTVTGHSSRTTGAAFLSGGSGITVTLDTTSTRQVTLSGLNSWRPEPGRYLVMARLYREGGGGTADVRLGQRWLGQTSWQPWRQFRPTTGGNRASWVPLGYLQHPIGDTGVGLDPALVMPPSIRVDARPVTTSSGLLHFDQFAFVPVDLARGAGERACFADFEGGIGFGDQFTLRVDAQHRRAAVVDGFGQYHAVPQPLRTGGWPVAVPGMATCVTVFLDTTDAPVGIDSVAVTSQLRIDAHPRLLHLGQE